MKATTYQLRSINGGQLVLGGSLPRDLTLDQAADWLVHKDTQFTVSNSGVLYFTYGHSPVLVYLAVDPTQTEQGKTFLKAWRDEKRSREDALAEQNLEAEREIEDLVESLGADEAIRRLKGG